MEFRHDRRAQSVVIGSVVLFGFLIVALSLYQVQVVPQQNAQAEFDHFQEVQDQFTVLRNAIARAGQANADQYESIQLGTTYPIRLIAINPPPPVGTLQTDGPYNISVGDTAIQTRFLEYQNGYNELNTGTIRYDNTVVYLEGTTPSERVIYQDQSLVIGDGRLRVTALQNALRESGTRRQSVELYPVKTPTTTLENRSGEITIKLPTRLNGSYWDSEIPSSLWANSASAVNESAYPRSSEVYRLELTANASDLKFNTVGINGPPQDGNETLQQNVGVESGGTETNETPPPPPSDLPGGEPVVGSPNVAFDDADDDGERDADEQTFTEAELYNFNDDSVNLVIPEAVGELRQQNEEISIEARSITSEVDIRSQNRRVELRATEGEILLTEGVRSDNREVEIYGKRIDISGAEIRADNGDITISATLAGGGELIASGSDTLIRSQNYDIMLESVGNMILDDATIRSQNGRITADLGGAYTISLSGTTVQNQNGPGAIQYTPSTVTESPERPIAEPQ